MKTNTLKNKPEVRQITLTKVQQERQATAQSLSTPRFASKRRRSPAANQARARAHRARLRARLRAAQARAKRRIQTGRVPIQDDVEATTDSGDTEHSHPVRHEKLDDRVTGGKSAKVSSSTYDIPTLLRANGA